MLRYACESHPNVKIKTVHFEKRLPTIPHWLSSMSEKPTKEAEAMKQAILKIDGVTEVSAKDYSLTITRSGVFQWSEIVPKCVDIIKNMMAVDEMTEVPAFAE
jgi:hypothetical protein